MSKIKIEHVNFDEMNPEHLRAFEMLVLGIKQPNGSVKFQEHPFLRFKLEKPFTSIHSMMINKIGRAYLSEKLK